MKNLLIYLALVAIMIQAGCSGRFDGRETTPPFGSSVRRAVASQTANPEAGGDAPVAGVDGRYSAAVMEKYQKGPREGTEKTSGSLFEGLEGSK